MNELKPLKITCTSTDCTNNLHCFRRSKRTAIAGVGGRCRACGAALVDWPRVYRRSLEDVDHTFAALKLELIRHHFWHVVIAERAVNYALKKGRLLLVSATSKQIRRSIGPEVPFRDGRQTPREDSPRANAIHYAQHATGSCCRKCLEEWHGIPQGRELTDDEISYLTSLAMLYLEERIPHLTDYPQRVGALPKRTAGQERNRQVESQPSHAA